MNDSVPETAANEPASARDLRSNAVFKKFVAKAGRSYLPILLLACFFFNLAWSIRSQSQTADEAFHLAAGYRYWQCGDFGINPEHPPLVKFVAAAPLWFSHLPPLQGTCGKESTTKDFGYILGLYNLYARGIDGDSVLLKSRLAASSFAMTLALFSYLFARSLFGETAGTIALALVTFEPTALAHGALITTDTALSAFMVAAVFSVYRFYRHPSPGLQTMAGVFTGLALAVKHSGVLLIPITLLLAAAEFGHRRYSQSGIPAQGARRLWRDAGSLFAIWLIAVAVLWSSYGFRFAARPAAEPMSLSLQQYIAEAQAEATHSLLLNRVIPILYRLHMLPEAYLYGMADVINTTDPGKPAYLLGRLYPNGRWFYFPAAFVIKTTLGFQLLLLIAVALGGWTIPERSLQAAYLAIPAAVMFGFGMQSGLDIGFRHMLPAIAFLCILAAGGSAYLLQGRRWWMPAIAACLLCHVASSLRSFPNYLPYANELWGGPSETWRYLSDSNDDWGQELYQTRRYLVQNRIQDCWIAYPTRSNVILNAEGIPCRQLSPLGDPGNPPASVVKGTFLVSAFALSGTDFEPGLNPYADFQKVRPETNIDGGMLVYSGAFDLAPIFAATLVSRSDSLLSHNQPELARSEAESAVRLTPASVRAHLSLAHALLQTGDSEAARHEFVTSLRLAEQKGREWYPTEIARARHGIDFTEKMQRQP